MKGKALTYAAFGARGTGKTAWVKQLIARLNPPRLMVWDFKHDPSLVGMGEPHTSLPGFIEACREKRFSLRYLVDHAGDIHAQFDLFCKAAWVAGDVLVFVDELPEVTKANKAPQAWRQLVNVGREYQHGGKVKRVAIIGAGQRPAECDKSFIANADVVHVGRLGNASDAQAMARSWGLNQREFMDLPDLHWREKRADMIEIQRGVLSFGNKKTATKTTP
ncbi:AAA family ATPase [Acidovorax sp. LjRoot194]|uniref:AAA family ATPase n=1 Tax=Acidovorax sp. LjRoot194 TaxID=3342280 RepID=UPI003ECEC071